MTNEKTVPELLRELAAAEHGIELAEMFRDLADRVEREYIERPRFEDGAVVEVGDMVLWNDCESKRVEGIHVEVHLEGACGTYNSVLKRPEPEVLDADGVPIKVGDTVWLVGNSEYFDVLGIENVYVHIGRKDNTSTDAFVYPFDLTHKQPDSLERIEEDALMDSILYCDKYGLLDNGCNAQEGDDAVRHCTDCVLSCETRMVKHLLNRQRALLERGQA